MSRVFQLAALITLTALAGGCATEKKLSFESRPVSMGYLAKRSVAIVFSDQRMDVLNGSENQDFCGTMESTAGNKVSLVTPSGKPLAEAFTAFLTQSAKDSGWNAESMPVSFRSTEATIIPLFQKTKQERLLLINIFHWEAGAKPGFSRIAYTMNYEFELKVFDRNGKMLAVNHIRDFIQKDGDELITKMSTMEEWKSQIMASSKYSDKKKLDMLARISFTKQMKDLFNNEAVRAALQ